MCKTKYRNTRKMPVMQYKKIVCHQSKPKCQHQKEPIPTGMVKKIATQRHRKTDGNKNKL